MRVTADKYTPTERYICSWCEMRDGYLSAVPHPKSNCQDRRFVYPREADIVGRVIGVTMRLSKPNRECLKIGLVKTNLVSFGKTGMDLYIISPSRSLRDPRKRDPW
jgi:hypothetical protein